MYGSSATHMLLQVEAWQIAWNAVLSLPSFRDCFAASPKQCYCPICGHEFDKVQPVNRCPTTAGHPMAFLRDELISEDADYAWVE